MKCQLVRCGVFVDTEMDDRSVVRAQSIGLVLNHVVGNGRTLRRLVTKHNANAIQIKVPLAASYVRAGRQDDAEWVAEEVQIFSPTTTVSSIEKAIPIAQPAFKQALLEGLRKTGIPE